MRHRLPAFLKTSKLSQALIIFLLAFGVRLVYLYQIHDNPFFNTPVLDEYSYDRWARRIAGGQWLGTEIFYQDPLYPYFLGVEYSIVGRDLFRVRALQFAIGSASCVLIFLLADSFFDRKTGVVAGVLAALYKPFFYFEGLLLKSFLAVFLISLFMLVLMLARGRRSFLLWVLAGVILGLLALVRANVLVLVPAVIVWAFVPGVVTDSIARKAVAAAGVVVGLILILAPVTVRNYVVGKDFVLITSQAGQNFLIGNNPSNVSGRYQPPITVRPNPRYEQADFRIQAEIATGRKLKPSEVSAYWFSEAFRFIRDEPLRWLTLMLKKFWLFWNWYEVPDNQNFYFFRQYSSVLGLPLPNFRFVAALGLTGMLLCLPRWRRVLLLYLVVLLYSATVIAFYVFARYRLPVVPGLIVFASYALASVPRTLAEKHYSKLLAAALITLLFWGLLGTHVSKDSYYADTANAYSRLASVYQSQGKLDEALAAYKQATRILPYQWSAYLGMGEIYEQRGEMDLAIENYRRARIYNPGNPDTWLRLGRLCFEKGELDESAKFFGVALGLKPDSLQLHYWLAKVHAARGNDEQASYYLDQWKELQMSNRLRALDLAPDSPP